MMQRLILACSVLLSAMFVNRTSAQQAAENLVIVTLDGLRWQEVFRGIDTTLVSMEQFTRGGKRLREKFGHEDITESRRKLMPFLWQTVAREGVLLGNRDKGSLMNLANPYWFSYPGYNELLTGYPDTLVNSNDKILNANVTVLEFLHRMPGMAGKVAVFGTWDVFPYIINNRRSGIYVNAGTDSLPLPGRGAELLNDLQQLSPQPIDVRPDVATYLMAREYLLHHKPKVLYIAFDETDDFAHAGMYDQYLKSAHAQDAMMADLWNLLQSMPEYRGKTSLLITTDHGRGDADKNQWTSHGSRVPDCNQTWMAAMGPGIAPLGEYAPAQPVQHAQIAATIGLMMGYYYRAAHPVAPAIESIFERRPNR